jgi:acyl-CoA dehydrogenase
VSRLGVAANVRAAARIGVQVAAPAADDVDRNARFPSEAIGALRRDRLVGAAIPEQFGGLGLSVTSLAQVGQVLAESCASTAMIWTMHQIQMACIAHHSSDAPYFSNYLRSAAEHQFLVASVTSEVGVGGDIRSSLAAVDRDGATCRVAKHGATVSYALHADAFLLTARRAPDAPRSDQVLVLVLRDQAHLEPTGDWDTLGMRGTCSPPVRVTAMFPAEQIVSVAFADICARTMVPYSHILWSACWVGIATDAVRRARRFLKMRSARSSSASTGDTRLADVSTLLHQMRAHVFDCAVRYDEMLAQGLQPNMQLAIEMNQLKLAASDLVVKIVSQSLAILGVSGYSACGEYSVARHLRDAYSASCMISNERLREANAAMLLVYKGI